MNMMRKCNYLPQDILTFLSHRRRCGFDTTTAQNVSQYFDVPLKRVQSILNRFSKEGVLNFSTNREGKRFYSLPPSLVENSALQRELAFLLNLC